MLMYFLLSSRLAAAAAGDAPWCTSVAGLKAFDYMVLTLSGTDEDSLRRLINDYFIGDNIRADVNTNGTPNEVVANLRDVLCTHGLEAREVLEALNDAFPGGHQRIVDFASQWNIVMELPSNSAEPLPSQDVSQPSSNAPAVVGQRARTRSALAWSGAAGAALFSGASLLVSIDSAQDYEAEAYQFVLGTGNYSAAEIEQMRVRSNRFASLSAASACTVWPLVIVAASVSGSF